MRRRRLLALLAGSAGTLSGCAGVGELGRGSTDEDLEDLTPAPVPDPTERPTAETDDDDVLNFTLSYTADFERANRRLALPTRAVRLLPDSRLELGFERPRGDGDPVLLRGWLSNESFEETSVSLSSLAPFAGNLVAEHVGDSGATVTLVPTPNDGLATGALPTDRVDAPACHADGEGLDAVYPDEVRLGAGEVRPLEFRVCLGAVDFEFPTGRYRFAESESDGDSSGTFGPTHFVAWDPKRPGPTEGSALGGPTVPSFPQREVAWYHQADATETLWYRPSEERVAPPATVAFTLTNRTAEPVPVSRHHPRLFKMVDESWYRISYRRLVFVGTSSATGPLAPGDTTSRSLCLANGNQDTCEEGTPGVGHLGGGRYAAVADLGDGRVGRAALLDVDAPPVTVEPSEEVSVRERTEETVVVGVGDGEVDDHSTSHTTVLVERIGDAERRLIAEQIMQPNYAALRETLPFFEPDVERVELYDANNRLRYQLDREHGMLEFVFGGDPYRAAVERHYVQE